LVEHESALTGELLYAVGRNALPRVEEVDGYLTEEVADDEGIQSFLESLIVH